MSNLGGSTSIPPRLDLAANGLLPPLPTSFLAGRDLDLLAPYRFVVPGKALDLPPAPPAVDRRALAAGLAVANRAYGHPRADELAQKLADPRTRVVATGQQPGLFGGPLLTVAKMIAASRWAAEIEARGEPAVAVFWVATEDHDWAEVSRSTFLSTAGPSSVDLGPDPEALAPVGTRTFGAGVEAALAQLGAALPSEFDQRWLAEIAQWYRPDARFGEAFCRLMARLLGPRCPLMLDALLPELKAAERPWLRRLVEKRDEVEAHLAAADSEVVARGYTPQVAPQRGASPLFVYRHGGRRRIEWRGSDRFVLRGREEESSVESLLATIEENPGVVSPGVLARPAIQDAVLGTSLFLVGPGELSYLAQASATYRALGIEAPALSLRPQTLVLEAAQAAFLEREEISLADLLGDPAALDRHLAKRVGGDFTQEIRQNVAAALDRLTAPAMALDKNLERPLEKTREQVLRALDLFAEKANQSAVRRVELENRRLAQLREATRPGGTLQERVLSSAQFGRYGPAFAEAYWRQIDLDPRILSVIVLPRLGASVETQEGVS